MATVNITLRGIGTDWTKACRKAVTDLNPLFKKSGVKVTLANGAAKGPVINVKIDSSINGAALHGTNRSEFSDSGVMLRASVSLPTKVTINTPSGVREAGIGILEVIAAHEFVHALGTKKHSTYLMAQTFSKEMGDTANKDTLKAGTVKMPPLKLSPQSVKELKAIWK
jgi:hypothetical protein